MSHIQLGVTMKPFHEQIDAEKIGGAVGFSVGAAVGLLATFKMAAIATTDDGALHGVGSAATFIAPVALGALAVTHLLNLGYRYLKGQESAVSIALSSTVPLTILRNPGLGLIDFGSYALGASFVLKPIAGALGGAVVGRAIGSGIARTRRSLRHAPRNTSPHESESGALRPALPPQKANASPAGRRGFSYN